LLGRALDDRFELLERIGEGRMGVVYRARQISVERTVAVRILYAEMAHDPQWIQRFLNEGKVRSRLQHPNTVRVIDFGQSAEGLPFIAMELIDGISLRRALDGLGDGAALPPERVLRIIIQCCLSLAEAHGIGMIHRDLKPESVFLASVGRQRD